VYLAIQHLVCQCAIKISSVQFSSVQTYYRHAFTAIILNFTRRTSLNSEEVTFSAGVIVGIV